MRKKLIPFPLQGQKKQSLSPDIPTKQQPQVSLTPFNKGIGVNT